MLLPAYRDGFIFFLFWMVQTASVLCLALESRWLGGNS